MTNNKQPIGLFDSGVGGTSIWKEIHALMPYENTLYLADSKNAPYGQRTKDEIIALSCKNTEFLLHANCKIIVVACNTATTNAISVLREKYKVPFIGIEPAIKPAALHSKTQKIGILATQGTLSSELFSKAVQALPHVEIMEQIGHGLVPLIENGLLESEEMQQLLKQYLQPMIDNGIDNLVLGCSHYPYLIPQIKKIIPSNITIIDSGLAVAKQTQHVLQLTNQLNQSNQNAHCQFLTNSSTEVLSALLNHQFEVQLEDF